MKYEEHFNFAVSKLNLVLEATGNSNLKKSVKKIMEDFSKGLKSDNIIKTTAQGVHRPSMIVKKLNGMSASEKLNYLSELSQKNISYEILSSKKYQKMREKKNKLTSKKCFVCGEKAYCMHHIVPLICGGTNRKRNLMPICKDCHKKIHSFMV